MELQALLVLGGLAVAGAAVLLLMGLFSASGTSYEEAMAQQRRATTELLALAESKGKPKKNVKKANKKAKKEKNKDVATAATGSDPESEAPAESGVEEDAPVAKPHVEFKPPVVVDIPRDTPPNVKIRKRGKDPKVKPILLNKEDPSCVSDPSAPPSPVTTMSNHFEDIHPKDEFELMHSSLAADKSTEKKEDVPEKKESKSGKQAKGKQAARAPPAAVAAAPEPAKDEPVEQPKEQPKEHPKEHRKGKRAEKKSQSEEVEAPREEVVPPLNAPQPSELTTEKLLKQALSAAPPAPAPAPVKPAPVPAAAHQTPPGKNKKKKQEPNVLALIAASGGVNVTELVRVVREAALSRNEIQILTDALLNKQHDPLPQHSDWTEGPNDPMQKMKKQLAEKEKALADEVEASQALHAKLKELRASLNAERSRGAAAARAAEEAAGEARALHARLQRASDDNHQLAQEKMHLQSKLSSEAEWQAQRVQMEMHIQRLSESEAALAAQASALTAEAGARAHEAAAARLEAGAAREQAAHAAQHAAELAHQLAEVNRVCAELDAARQAALGKEQAALQEIRQLQDRLNGMAELQSEVQRLTSRAQLADANAEKAKEETDKLKQQLSSEITSLKEQLSLRESELAEARQMKPPAQNGLPPSTNDKSVEVSAVESVVASLRAELESAAQTTQEQQAQVNALRDQLRQYTDKNNELRTKNWKVMEALQTAEKALQSKPSAVPAQDLLREALAKAEQAHYNEVCSVLRGASPAAAAAAAATPPGRAWLDAFVDKLKSEIQAASAKESKDNSEELRAQNIHLQGLVDKYKRIIDDTEGVLSRLQQNVTAEEQRWTQQLGDKQRELDELRQRTVTQMQKKIDELQAELVKAHSHNHSFAEAERHTEEKLMADLSNKHKLDSFNGPLQVGVEDK